MMDLEEEDPEPNVMVELLQWPSMVATVVDDIFSFSLNLNSSLPHHFPREDDLSSSPAKTFYLTTHYTGLGPVEHCLKELQAACNSKSKVVLWSGHLDHRIQGYDFHGSIGRERATRIDSFKF